VRSIAVVAATLVPILLTSCGEEVSHVVAPRLRLVDQGSPALALVAANRDKCNVESYSEAGRRSSIVSIASGKGSRASGSAETTSLRRLLHWGSIDTDTRCSAPFPASLKTRRMQPIQRVRTGKELHWRGGWRSDRRLPLCRALRCLKHTSARSGVVRFGVPARPQPSCATEYFARAFWVRASERVEARI
jgi:hypothetical protein